MLALWVALGCFFASMALATVDDPSRGERAGWRTYLSAALVAVSMTYLVLKLTGVVGGEP